MHHPADDSCRRTDFCRVDARCPRTTTWHKWYSQADVFLRRHPKARINCLGAGGAAARSHSSGATPAEKERHVADVATFDALELGGRYRALRERVPCRSRYLSNQ